MQSFLFILGIATLAAIAAVMSISRRRESRILRELAGRQRLNFTAEDLIDLHERYYRLHLVRQGHNHFAWNLLYGTTDEGLVSLFCYRYDLGFGVDQTHRSWWIAVLETPRCYPSWRAERIAEPIPPADQTPLLDKEGVGEVQPQSDRVAHPAAGGVGVAMIEGAMSSPDEYDHREVQSRSGNGECIASFIVQADRHDTIDRLQHVGLEEYLKEAAGVTHVEVCGHLVSLAAPRDDAPQVPLGLLAAVRRLARLLNDAVPVRSTPASARPTHL